MLVSLCSLNPHIKPANSTSFPPNAYMRKSFLNYPLYAFESTKINIYSYIFVYVCVCIHMYIARDKQSQKASLFPVTQESNILKTMFKTGI